MGFMGVERIVGFMGVERIVGFVRVEYMVVHVVVGVGGLAKFAYSLKIGSSQLRLFRLVLVNGFER